MVRCPNCRYKVDTDYMTNCPECGTQVSSIDGSSFSSDRPATSATYTGPAETWSDPTNQSSRPPAQQQQPTTPSTAGCIGAFRRLVALAILLVVLFGFLGTCIEGEFSLQEAGSEVVEEFFGEEGPREIDVFDLSVGDCGFIPEGQDGVATYQIVDCAAEHEFEAYALPVHPASPGDPFPGADAMQTWAAEACIEAFTGYTGQTYGEAGIVDITWINPSEGTWNDLDDRVVHCMMVHVSGELLEGSFAEPSA